MATRLTQTEFIQKSQDVHGSVYDYSNVDYINSTTPVKILCSKHGIFEQIPAAHMRGQGCPVCADRRSLGQTEFENRARQVHGSKYDYSKVVYINNRTKIQIVCPEHGMFEQTPHNHLKGRGCPFCAKNYKMSQSGFVKKAKFVHNNKYNYDQTVFTKTANKVTIICPTHGAFKQNAMSHLRGSGCPVCGQINRQNTDYQSRIETRRQTTWQKYGVANVMQFAKFKQKNLAKKFANQSFNQSNCEEILYQQLCETFGQSDVVRQYSSSDYPFRCDFYVKSRDLYIELNAYWHHGHQWFNTRDKDCQKQKTEWSKHSDESYMNALTVWTISDVKKRQAAKKSRLNYLVFWDSELRDAKVWFASGCPDAHDYDIEYSWLPLIDEDFQEAPEHLSIGWLSRIAKHYQRDVFFAKEIAMWYNNPVVKQTMKLRMWLLANRLCYREKLPTELTFEQILAGFKISGLHYGYSSFDATLMKEFLEDHPEIQSIYDPCAGWGERLLCSKMLDKIYTGMDINYALKVGYQQMIQKYGCDKQQVIFGDSSKNRPKKQYDAIITCPPYFNTEIYSQNGAENFSYPEFLKWWRRVVKSCALKQPVWFCFQINQKYKADLLQIVENQGFVFQFETTYRQQKVSHMNRKEGQKVTKTEFESFVVCKQKGA